MTFFGLLLVAKCKRLSANSQYKEKSAGMPSMGLQEPKKNT
jgi:hypothetical protein